jgi:hypothetical protein
MFAAGAACEEATPRVGVVGRLGGVLTRSLSEHHLARGTALCTLGTGFSALLLALGLLLSLLLLLLFASLFLCASASIRIPTEHA